MNRIFTTTPEFSTVLLEYADPSDIVLIFDTTFGTNIYGFLLGFFVAPDMHGASQVVAVTLLQHEDQQSLNACMRNLRFALNGGQDGDIVPKVLMTDGDAKIAKAILQELIMVQNQQGDWVDRVMQTLHLLCLFHLWLNV